MSFFQSNLIILTSFTLYISLSYSWVQKAHDYYIIFRDFTFHNYKIFLLVLLKWFSPQELLSLLLILPYLLSFLSYFKFLIAPKSSSVQFSLYMPFASNVSVVIVISVQVHVNMLTHRIRDSKLFKL